MANQLFAFFAEPHCDVSHKKGLSGHLPEIGSRFGKTIRPELKKA